MRPPNKEEFSKFKVSKIACLWFLKVFRRETLSLERDLRQRQSYATCFLVKSFKVPIVFRRLAASVKSFKVPIVFRRSVASVKSFKAPIDFRRSAAVVKVLKSSSSFGDRRHQ